jgi:hypothetical protein
MLFRLFRVIIQRALFRRLRKGSLVGVPLCSLPVHLRSSFESGAWLGTDLYRVSLARILQHEIGSFCQRIRWPLESEVYLRGVRVDFQSQLGLTLQESKRAERAYTEDSNSLCAQFPWLTLVDDRILVEVWTRGARCMRCNGCSGFSSAKELPSTDITEPVTPELSKCDPSTPPPSRE